MHGHTNIKFTSAKQAKGIHSYKNTKNKQLSPNYFAIKINGSNRKSANTLRATTHFRPNEEFHLIQLTSRQHRLCIIPQATNTV